MPDPQTNITEDGEPGDLRNAATDEFGGPEDIAADDAGTGALEGHVGATAGGQAPLGVGGQSGPAVGPEDGASEIAADDAGSGRAADKLIANGSGAD